MMASGEIDIAILDLNMPEMSGPDVVKLFRASSSGTSNRLPIIVHAGPEIPGLGETALELCRRFPRARLILAHDALTDLSWIFEHVEDHPNLFFDTSWWGPVHTMALFALVPPGRVLTASDLPYCSPLSGAITTLRCGIQAGLTDEQVRLAMGGQFKRLLAWEDPIDAGPAPGTGFQGGMERVFVTEAMVRACCFTSS